MEPVNIEVVGVMNELVVRVVEVMEKDPISLESGRSLSEFTGHSEGSPMSKPPTQDMSPIIPPIKDIQKDPMDDAIEQSIDKVRE